MQGTVNGDGTSIGRYAISPQKSAASGGGNGGDESGVSAGNETGNLSASTTSGAEQSASGGEDGNASSPGGSPAQARAGSQPGQNSIASSSGSSAGSEGSQNSAGATSGSASGEESGMSVPGSQKDINFDQQQNGDPNQEVVPNYSRPRTNIRAVALRRPIRVLVRDEQIGLVSDESRAAQSNLTGATIPFEGDTIESMDEFVKAVEAQVDGWGIAGDNLYWRPVLEIQVGPDGQRRADDLVRLLKNSDIEVQLPATATNTNQGAPRATR
jgi:hypothetical protein